MLLKRKGERMPYVLKNKQSAKYVAPRGRVRSYVKDIEDARYYHNKESAEYDKCGNEELMELNNVDVSRECAGRI
jgi:hypothetical protein